MLPWAVLVAQWMKAIVLKSEDLSLNLRSHVKTRFVFWASVILVPWEHGRWRQVTPWKAVDQQQREKSILSKQGGRQGLKLRSPSRYVLHSWTYTHTPEHTVTHTCMHTCMGVVALLWPYISSLVIMLCFLLWYFKIQWPHL